MATNQIGTVSIGIEADTRQFREQMRRIGMQGGNDLNRTMTKAFKAGAIIAAIKLIGDGIKNVTKSAMQFEAATQQVDRIFGANSQTVKNWARNNAIAFNMSTNEAIKFSSIYGNLISNITENQSENARITQELLQQSAVVASGTGRTMTDVMDRIRSGLLGNTEAIEDLGINVNVSMLESTEAFKKFANGKSWNQLTFQTQQQIRLNAILEQSYKKYGSEVNKNTSSSLARLNAILSNISLNIGQILKPVIDAIINSMIILASAIEKVTASFAKMINRITGNKEETKKMTDNTKSAIKGQEELGNAIAGAGKKAKGGVAGFDEVNQLQEQMAAGVGGVAASQTEVVTDETIDKTEEETTKLEEMFKTISEKVAPTFESLRGNILRVADALKPLFDEIGKLMVVIWEEFRPLFKLAFEQIGVILRGAGDFLEFTLKNWILIFKSVVKIIRQLIQGDFKGVFDTIKELFIGLWNNTKEYWGKMFTTIRQYLYNIWQATLFWWNWIKDWLNELWEGLKQLVINIWMPIIEFFKNLWGDISYWSSQIWNGIKDFLSNIWNGLKEKAKTIFNNIKNFFKNLWSGISKNTTSAWETLRDSLGNLWTSVWDTAKKTWKGIADTIKGFINIIISAINKLIDIWNDLEFKMPKKEFNVFGKKVEFGGFGIGTPNIPNIPMLEKGGVINSPTVAMMGEKPGESEAVLPLNQQTFEMLGNAIAGAMSGNGKDITINIDGQKIGRAMIPILNNENNRVGSRTVIQTG